MTAANGGIMLFCHFRKNKTKNKTKTKTKTKIKNKNKKIPVVG